MMRHLIWLSVLVLLFVTPSYAQSCNPASVSYIVRDEKGLVVSREDLTSIAKQLPSKIGDAKVNVSEVSFTSDPQTYFWPEDADFDKGNKMPALLFANAATCTMHLGEVDLSFRGKKMHLVFDIDINRTQDDRRQVIDSLRMQNGSFQLNLTGWDHSREKLIPAKHWKKIKA